MRPLSRSALRRKDHLHRRIVLQARAVRLVPGLEARVPGPEFRIGQPLQLQLVRGCAQVELRQRPHDCMALFRFPGFEEGDLYFFAPGDRTFLRAFPNLDVVLPVRRRQVGNQLVGAARGEEYAQYQQGAFFSSMTSVEISERNSSLFLAENGQEAGLPILRADCWICPWAIHSFVHERYQMALSDFRIR